MRNNWRVTASSPLGAGRTALVFGLDDGRVLRRYVGGADATAEAEIMMFVQRFGYPVPAVESAEGADIVMERIDGPTMLELLLDSRLDPSSGGAMLAELQAQLHAIPPRPGCPPSERLLHLDLHPGNVMIGSHGPVVIDWANARNGPPDLDLAVSALILASVIIADHPAAAHAAEMLAAYLGAAGGRPDRQLGSAVRMRSADPHLEPGEIALLDEAASLVRAALPRPGA